MWPFTRKKKEEPINRDVEQRYVYGRMPQERVLRRFTPTIKFWSDEFSSEYVMGQVYSIREGNDKLAYFADQWNKEGKIRYIK